MSGAYRFSFEPVFIVLALFAAALYVRAVRGAESGERPGRGRALVFVLGLALVAIPVNSPLETISAHYLLLAHLLQNALIADWGPPLLILGLTPAMRRDLAAAAGRPLELVTRPVPALALWLAVWYGVHLPVFYDWALRHDWPLNLEHLLLVGAGLVFWWAILGEPKRLEPLGTLAYLGVAFLTAPWLSLAYIFASHPFYAFYASAPRLWGISPIRDQNLAGILMNAEQTSIFFIALAWQLLRVLAEEEAAQRHMDAAYLEAHGP
ncbi:MAG TPA: cytochrome c oxidase assembly protein [Gaiellaceae bacterium]|nr:cytochrome c oxidase assembly protein [Gaiellaceae bacterium]